MESNSKYTFHYRIDIFNFIYGVIYVRKEKKKNSNTC